MDLDAVNNRLGEVAYFLESGDFEKAEDRLNEVHSLVFKTDNNELYFRYYLIRADLYKSTGRRELNLNSWDEMERYCETDIQKCIRLSYKAQDYLMLKRNEEAFNCAEAALMMAKDLDVQNSLLALQIKGECFKRKKDWSSAIEMYSSIASISEKGDNKAFVAKYHAKNDIMLYEMGYKRLAIDRLFEAEEHANALGNIELVQRIAIWRADLYRDTGENEKELGLLKVIAGFNNEYYF